LPYGLIFDIGMPVDLAAVSKAKYDLHRPWVTCVYNYIDAEGIILYDREHPESARPDNFGTPLSDEQRLQIRASIAILRRRFLNRILALEVSQP